MWNIALHSKNQAIPVKHLQLTDCNTLIAFKYIKRKKCLIEKGNCFKKRCARKTSVKRNAANVEKVLQEWWLVVEFCDSAYKLVNEPINCFASVKYKV